MNSRLSFLKQLGQAAVASAKTAVTGVDVVVEPAEPAGPEPVGTAIGRRAMAAAEHRVGAAALSLTGSATVLESGVTLAVYPGAGVALVQQALGLDGAPLPLDGDLELEATARDLAWLPLEIGRTIYARVSGARLLAVGNYRRAALVRFERARPRYPGVWCCLGDDALLPGSDAFVMDEPARLLRAAAAGGVESAILGGAALEAALQVPGAAVVQELEPAPVWGLFSSGRVVPVAAVSDAFVEVLPAEVAE